MHRNVRNKLNINKNNGKKKSLSFVVHISVRCEQGIGPPAHCLTGQGAWFPSVFNAYARKLPSSMLCEE